MRKILALLVAIGMIAAITPLVGAADKGYINVTLTPGGTASITVAPTSWDGEGAVIGAYGTSGATDFNLTNDGSIPVDVDINASDSEAWTLETAPDYNKFNLSYTTDSATYVLIGTSGATFATNLPAAAGGTYYDLFGLKVGMPTSTSTNDAQHFQITFVATPAA